MSIRNELLEEILTAIQTDGLSGKAYIVLQSDTIQAISEDGASPTVLDNWVVKASNGLSLQGDSVRNDTGRTLDFMHGTIGVHPQVDGGGGTRLFNLNSEVSLDGVTYTLNDQYRPIYTINNTETYSTTESYLADFEPSEYVRFIAFVSGGAMSVAPSSTSFRGETKSGPAMLWILHEA